MNVILYPCYERALRIVGARIGNEMETFDRLTKLSCIHIGDQNWYLK